jgi:hypothetical protein
MTKNQFFYTQKTPIQGKTGEFKTARCSLNISKVIRSISLDDGRVLILMDDIHQRPHQVEILSKAKKVIRYRTEMSTFQSELYLTESSDIERFYEVTSVDEGLIPPQKNYENVLINDTTEVVKG